MMIVSVKPFTAHADDSGKRNTELAVVAGYLAESQKWAVFQNRWMAKIKNLGIDEFRRSAYNTKKLGTDLLFELADIIHDCVDFGFACFIYCDDWREVAKEYTLELYHVFPYSACARTCIGLAREWCAKNNVKSEHMAYIFDKGSENAGELIELLKIDESQEARDIAFTTDDSKCIAGLQASDFLAWEMRNQWLNGNPDPQGWSDLSPILAHLLKGPPFEFDRIRKMPKFGFYRKPDLEGLCRRAQIPLLKDIPPDIWSLLKPIRLKWPATKP